MNNRSLDGGPEQLLLTRLYSAQRHLRLTRSLSAALRWFACGSILAAGILLAVWNLNLLPGPWQWAASAGRPREVLWLPGLIALGGFASRFFLLPRSRETAFRLDRLLDSRERLLTAVDWIFSEKPRTENSERVLMQACHLVEDEASFHPHLKKLEPVSRGEWMLLSSFLLPLSLVLFLPAHRPLPPDTSLWLGEAQVDQLTQELLQELEDTGDLKETEEKLAELLENMGADKADPSKQQETTTRDLQQVIDQMQQQAEAREKARELLETLAERARQNQKASDNDKNALEALRRNLADKEQSATLEQAQKDWERGDFQQAAEGMESVQKEMGESSQGLQDLAKQAGKQGQIEGDQSPLFDENQGDQFNEDGTPKNGSGNGNESGAQGGTGQSGEGEGTVPGPAPGRKTTLEEEASTPADGGQSLRQGESTSEWMEEYKHLHAPERTEFQKAQTRVRGELGEEGPRFRTAEEGLGTVTEPAHIDGSGGLLEYREEAENAILRDEVPADYRDNVRVYFESLDRKP